MVHAAISSPCGKGTSSPATQYATHSISVLGLEKEKPVAGGWGWNPRAALEQLPVGRVTGGRGAWLGSWRNACRLHWQCFMQAENQSREFYWQGKTASEGATNFNQIQVRLIKASWFQGLFLSSTVWCLFICINLMMRASTPIIPPSFDFVCPGCLQWHIMQQLKYLPRVSLPSGNCKINPVQMDYLIQMTYHTLLLVPLT